MSPQRFPLLGSWVDAVTAEELVEAIACLVEAGRGAAIANHNMHSLALLRRGAFPPGWYESAELIHADGMMVVWTARLAGQAMARTHRTTYVDWLTLLLDRANRGRWRIYHIGGEGDHLPRLTAVMAERWPGIIFAGGQGFFPEAGPDELAAAEAVASHRPQLVLAGMGMPRQERWLQRHRGRFPQAVLLPCGAAAKYLTGAEPTPPRWLGRLGLEWLHRFAADPRRLWRRYLVEPFGLVVPVLGHVVRCRLAKLRK